MWLVTQVSGFPVRNDCGPYGNSNFVGPGRRTSILYCRLGPC